eukprot:scaffold83889_cov30-Phaeocystis_antarctica.AAC.1
MRRGVPRGAARGRGRVGKPQGEDARLGARAARALLLGAARAVADERREAVGALVVPGQGQGSGLGRPRHTPRRQARACARRHSVRPCQHPPWPGAPASQPPARR